jgi:hypothetical protein
MYFPPKAISVTCFHPGRPAPKAKTAPPSQIFFELALEML